MSANRDRVEYWLDGGGCLGGVDSSFAPDRGDLLTLGETTYEVVGRTYTVDYPSSYHERRLTCILTVKVHEGEVARLPR